MRPVGRMPDKTRSGNILIQSVSSVLGAERPN
jgi:hypothetical protein